MACFGGSKGWQSVWPEIIIPSGWGGALPAHGPGCGHSGMRRAALWSSCNLGRMQGRQRKGVITPQISSLNEFKLPVLLREPLVSLSLGGAVPLQVAGLGLKSPGGASCCQWLSFGAPHRPGQEPPLSFERSKQEEKGRMKSGRGLQGGSWFSCGTQSRGARRPHSPSRLGMCRGGGGGREGGSPLSACCQPVLCV